MNEPLENNNLHDEYSDDNEEEEEVYSDDEDEEERLDFRDWKVIYPSQEEEIMIKKIENSEDDNINNNTNEKHNYPIKDFTFIVQTRSDDPTPYLPENLYTSLVYQFHQAILFHESIRKSGEEVTKAMQSQLDPTKAIIPANLVPEQLNKNTASDEVIVGETKGLELTTPPTQLYKDQTNVEEHYLALENRSKFSIGVVSFHYKQKAFVLQLRYYFPENYPPVEDEQDKPFCVVQSAPFHSFARRRNAQKVKEQTKRKRLLRAMEKNKKLKASLLSGLERGSFGFNFSNLLGNSTFGNTPLINSQPEEPVSKKTVQNNLEQEFMTNLKDLIVFSSILSEDERKLGLGLALRKLAKVDHDVI
ncbi:hypothetical protein ABK040_007243 [Willaertia magna]